MKIQVAKKFSCEVEIFNGDKLVDKYITNKSQKQKEQWQSYVLSKLDDQQNIREIVKKHPYKKDNNNG